MHGARIRSMRLLWLLTGLAILALLVGGFTLYRPFAPVFGKSAAGKAAMPPRLPGKRSTFLVMGVDKRSGDVGRADSMVLLSYDPAANQVAMVSLPRDTWTQIPGHGYDKINHSYAYGGEELAVESVEHLLDIPIDHYVTLSFQGFERIVDGLGGVELDAEKRLQYTDPFDTDMGPDGLVIDIQPGWQRMDGVTALKYARFRMDDEGDVGRIRRQQQVARALMRTAVRPATIGRLPELIMALSSAMVTDLSIADMLTLATGAKEALAQPLKSAVFGGDAEELDGVYYVISDLVKDRSEAYQTLVGAPPTAEFLQRAREDQIVYDRALSDARSSAPQVGASPEPSGQQGKSTSDSHHSQTAPTATTNRSTKGGLQPVTVAIIDSSGKNLARKYAEKFRAVGFRIARQDRTNRRVERTVALDHANQAGTANRLLAVIPHISIVSVPNPKANEAVEIVLGADLD